MDGLELHALAYRLILVLRFVVYLAACYLALHVLVARIGSPGGKVLAFFETVTGPLTRPVRALAPAMPERRVRHVTLGILFGLWLISVWLLAIIGRRIG